MPRLGRLSTDLLMLFLPFSVFWPLGEPVVEVALPLYVTWGVHLSDVALILVLILGLLQSHVQRVGPRIFFWPLAGLCLLALLSTFVAYSPPFALYTTFRWVLALLVYLWLVQPAVDVSRAVRVLLLGLCFHVSIGIAQVLNQGPLGLPGELALPAHISGAAIIPVDGERWLRAYGLTFHPNVLGGYLAYALVVCTPLLKSRFWTVVWWWLWLGLFLTFSRAAWIAAALGVGIALVGLIWRSPASRRPVLAASAGAAVLLAFCAIVWLPQLATRVQPLTARLGLDTPQSEAAPVPAFEERSLDEREEFLQISLDFIARRPLVGVGAGGFPIAIMAEGIHVLPQFAHIVPLNLAAEVGVLAAVLWLALWFGGAWQLAAGRRTNDHWRIALLAGWLAIGLIALADSYPWSLDAGRLLTVAALGLAGNRLTVGEPAAAGE